MKHGLSLTVSAETPSSVAQRAVGEALEQLGKVLMDAGKDADGLDYEIRLTAVIRPKEVIHD